jgi:hypothetical protein
MGKERKIADRRPCPCGAGEVLLEHVQNDSSFSDLDSYYMPQFDCNNCSRHWRLEDVTDPQDRERVLVRFFPLPGTKVEYPPPILMQKG